MKKTNILQSSPEEKIEFNCKCCEALGISDVIREMLEKDLRKDLRLEAKKSQEKS